MAGRESAMRAERMELRDFRNLRETVCSPGARSMSPGEKMRGENQSVEALWLFTGSKSFRGARDRELIALSQTEAQLNLAFYAEDRRQEAAIKIGSRRTAELNGIPQSSASSLAGHFAGWCFRRPSHPDQGGAGGTPPFCRRGLLPAPPGISRGPAGIYAGARATE